MKTTARNEKVGPPSAATLAVWEKGSAPAMIAPSMRPKHAAAPLGIGISTLWRWAAEKPGFPQPMRLSARCTVWASDALIAWRDAQA